MENLQPGTQVPSTWWMPDLLEGEQGRQHTAEAPAGYPWVHHLTRPLRTAASAQGDADRLHLWAGDGWRQIRDLPAADLVTLLAAELAAA